MNEFILLIHSRLARDKLKNINQNTSVQRCLADYRNVIRMREYMSQGKRIDRFIDGFKYIVRVEVMKTNCVLFKYLACIALNVDSAI